MQISNFSDKNYIQLNIINLILNLREILLFETLVRWAQCFLFRRKKFRMEEISKEEAIKKEMFETNDLY